MFPIRGEGQGGLDVLDGEFREIREDLCGAHACRKPAKDIIHRNPHVPDTGLSTPFAGFDRDALAIVIRAHAGKVVYLLKTTKNEVDHGIPGGRRRIDA
jgi:hypothetical protein